MNKKSFLLVLCAALILCACGTLQVNIEPTPSVQTPIPLPTQPVTLLPAVTFVPPSPTPAFLPVVLPKPGTVVLDFVASVCKARWANGGRSLPCPGSLDDLAEGYVATADNAIAEEGIPVAAPMLIVLPGTGTEHGAGLFGRYPPITIQAGDTFHAILACHDQSACNVTFELQYFDAQGKYHKETGWSWKHTSGDGPTAVEADLSPLAGQTVELQLSVPIQDSTIQYHWMLWIAPYVAREAR